MLPLGDQLAIYRSRGITMMRYVGGTDATNRLVMAFNDVPAGSTAGILGLNCVVDVAGLGHVVLSQSDVYIFDGTSTRSVLDKRARDWLRDTIDETNAKRAFLVNNADKSEVWVCIPESGQAACTKALVFNYADNTLGVRDVPSVTCGIHAPVTEGSTETWTSVTGNWSDKTAVTWSSLVPVSKFRKTVLGGAKLYVVGNADDENGTAMVSQAERQYIALGDNQRVKLIRSVWPRLEASVAQTFEITVGTSMSNDEAISWGTPVTYTYGTSRFVPVNRAGRYLAVRFRTTGDPWRLRSMDVDIQPQGTW